MTASPTDVNGTPQASFKVSVVGPSRVGKTTLLTAILSETERLLAGSPVTITMDERTESRVRSHRIELRRAIELGEFDAAALGGTQQVNRYQIALATTGEAPVQIPFSILDYPGGWLNPDTRARFAQAAAGWPECREHIRSSVMLLVPIDSAVLMEAVTPRQRASVVDVLGLLDVEEMGKEWAKARNDRQHRDEPAVVVLAPLKCERYFDDNGGRGHEAGTLRAAVRERYHTLLDVVRRETPNRPMPVRIVYAPIDTYGCVELMEARWLEAGGTFLDFTAHYRFRTRPPKLAVKAAGSVMQELCRCVIAGQERVDAAAQAERQRAYQRHVARRIEDKGFWGTLNFYLSGEAWENRLARQQTAGEIELIRQRRTDLKEAMEKLAAAADDPRVEVWGPEEVW